MSSFMVHGDLFPVGKYQYEHRFVLPYQFNNFPSGNFDKRDFNQTYWADEHLIIFYDYPEDTDAVTFAEIVLGAPDQGIMKRVSGDKTSKRQMVSFDIIGRIGHQTYCLMKTEIYRQDKNGDFIPDSVLFESEKKVKIK
jgi:hypothetical protein